MKVGVLGTGDVGKKLADSLLALGHEVMMGSRTATNAKALSWTEQAGPKASAGTFAEAAAFGEMVILATLGTATEDAVGQAGAAAFGSKVVIDAANPLDLASGFPPRLTIGHDDSLGERLQRMLPQARVVKAFNTVGHGHMFRPHFAGGPPDMFICGDDGAAKEKVAALLHDFGWGTVDIGGIVGARYLEPMALVWISYGALTGTWSHAFKLLRAMRK